MIVALGLTLAFLSELGALAGAALLSARLAPDGLRLAAGLSASVLLALAWGRWAAPRSSRRLSGPALLAFKLAVFALGAAGLALSGHPAAAAALLAAAALGLVLARDHAPVGGRPPAR